MGEVGPAGHGYVASISGAVVPRGAPYPRGITPYPGSVGLPVGGGALDDGAWLSNVGAGPRVDNYVIFVEMAAYVAPFRGTSVYEGVVTLPGSWSGSFCPPSSRCP